MITIVTLNPCIDKTIEVNDFLQGQTNRATSTRSDIGGKGINVSLVLKTLGIDSTNILIDYTAGNITISEFLIQKGITPIAIKYNNSLRTNIKIVDTANSTMTEINESGSAIPIHIVNQLWSEFQRSLQRTSLLILCGSVPDGIEVSIYKEMIDCANALNIPTILDSSGLPFTVAIDAKPYLVKPNLQELEEYTGCNISCESDIIDAALKLAEKGIRYICVSNGSKGAYLITKNQIIFTNGTEIKAKSPLGAGDSMIASFARSIFLNSSDEDMLIDAVAAAQATVMCEGTLLCTEADYKNLRKEIAIKRLQPIDNG